MHTSLSRKLVGILAVTVVPVVFLLSVSCQKKAAPVLWPEETWPTATPESQGVDSTVLAGALRTLRGQGVNIHSILLIRNGYVVLDAAFYPYDGKSLHDVASVTKSVTATLVGQAVREGVLPGLEAPIGEVLEGQGPAKPPGGWENVTLERLMTMSSGLACGDPPVEETLFHVRSSPHWVRFILGLEVVEEPGSRFDYCSPNFHLLSAAVHHGAGTSLANFARGRLFGPLGITRYQWPRDPQGVNVGWGDLRLSPADMARLGYLYMRQGRWKDRQVLPRGWVEEAVAPRLSIPGGQADYGYGWWLARGDFKGVYEARGRGGQSITVWPGMGILLITTGGGFDRDTVVQALLPAITHGAPLPENPDALRDLARAVAAAVGPPEPEPVERLPSGAATLSGRWFTLDSNALGLERLALTFEEGGDEAALKARVAGMDFLFPVGLDGVYRFSEVSPSGDPAAVRGRWETENRFVLDYNEITRINRFRMELTFSGDDVTLVYSEPTGQIAGKVRGKAD